MSTNDSIDKARRGFEASFSEKMFYDIQTYDDEHLQRIMKALDIQDEYQVLDLGTGSGFLAFPLAERFPESQITGLDILPQALARDAEKASAGNITNLHFVCYDGMNLPFEDESFDVVVSRYCLHHFPDIEQTFGEIARVLKLDGQFFVSDPTPNEDDSRRFVDAYMQMKDDGHNKFYTKDEFVRLAENAGLKLESCFDTHIRFPRKSVDAYRKIAEGVDEGIIAGYDIKIADGQVFITEKVLNLSFRKIASR